MQHAGLPLAVAVALLGLWLRYSTPLSGEVQGVIGAIRVYDDGPLGVLEVFTYRPLPYRAFLGLFHVGASLAAPPGTGLYEVAVISFALAFVAVAGVMLSLGLRRYLPVAESVAVGAAAAIGLGLAQPYDYLQPEWVSAGFVLLGVGAALMPRTTWVAGTLSGLFIVFAFAVKLATAPLALMALLGIYLVDRRRAGAAFLGSCAWGLAWLAMLLAIPAERQWTLDVIRVAASAPWRVGIDARYLVDEARTLASKAVVAPVIVLAPAAAITLAKLAPRSHRALVGAACAAAILLAVLPLLVQGTTYLTHAAMLPVLSAILCAFALTRAVRRGVATGYVLTAALLLLAVFSAFALSLPTDEREHMRRLVLLVALAIAIALGIAVMSLTRPHRRHRGMPSGLTAAYLPTAALVTAMIPALLPTAAWSFDPELVTRTNSYWARWSAERRVDMTRLSARIGRETPVLYLAFGDVPYYMGNPTHCQHPVPFLLRLGTVLGHVKDSETYRENLACLGMEGHEFVVVQPDWMYGGPLTGDLRSGLGPRYDCTSPISEAGVQACPRRARTSAPPRPSEETRGSRITHPIAARHVAPPRQPRQ